MSVRAPARLWLFALAGSAVAGALDVLQSVLKQETAWPLLAFRGLRWVPLGMLAPVAFYLGRRWPIRRAQLGRALAVHAMGALVLSIGWPALGVLLRRALGVWLIPGLTVTQDLATWTLTALPWTFPMYFGVLGCVHAFTYYVEARDREAHTARLRGQLAEARLNALRLQLEPHFLFNSLNAVLVLVRDQDTTTAARMLERLSGMLREVLRPNLPHECSIDDELSLTDQYVGIEQVRFSDGLQVTYAVPNELRSAAVPRFILQPLVENAIRHGGDDGRTLVEIGAARCGSDLELWVRNNGPGPPSPPRTDGVGLENTRLRLATLYGALATIELAGEKTGGTVARVRLPYHLPSRP